MDMDSPDMDRARTAALTCRIGRAPLSSDGRDQGKNSNWDDSTCGHLLACNLHRSNRGSDGDMTFQEEFLEKPFASLADVFRPLSSRLGIPLHSLKNGILPSFAELKLGRLFLSEDYLQYYGLRER